MYYKRNKVKKRKLLRGLTSHDSQIGCVMQPSLYTSAATYSRYHHNTASPSGSNATQGKR